MISFLLVEVLLLLRKFCERIAKPLGWQIEGKEISDNWYKLGLCLFDGDSYSHSQYNMIVDKEWVENKLEIPFSLGETLSW